MSGSRRGALALLVCGAAVVLVARLVSGLGAPPLYDSFTQPDPYRYLHPTGGERGSPAKASKTVAYTGADPGPITLATAPGENPPQAQLLLGANALSIPSGTTSITVSITPVDTPRAEPGDNVVVGNTYRFRAVTDGGVSIPLSAAQPATLVLRGPTGTGLSTVERFDGTRWTPLTTSPIAGPDIFAANTTQLGDFALVAPRAHVSSGGFPWLPWAAGGAAVLIVGGEVGFLLLARRRRERRARR